jgi:DNA-binding NarL/FixJ family response regulator
MKKDRVLIADDHELVRRALREIIDMDGKLEVCGEASNGREAVELAQRLRPAVIVLDVGMPELNGVEVTRQIKQSVPETEILVITGMESEDLVHQLLTAGARGYLVKNDTTRHVLPAVNALREKKAYLTSRAAQLTLDCYLKHSSAAANGAPGLSSDECEIVKLLAEGGSDQDVAAKLGITVKAAEAGYAAVMEKLHCRNFSDLVRYAVRNKIVEA